MFRMVLSAERKGVDALFEGEKWIENVTMRGVYSDLQRLCALAISRNYLNEWIEQKNSINEYLQINVSLFFETSRRQKLKLMHQSELMRMCYNHVCIVPKNRTLLRNRGHIGSIKLRPNLTSRWMDLNAWSSRSQRITIDDGSIIKFY